MRNVISWFHCPLCDTLQYIVIYICIYIYIYIHIYMYVYIYPWYIYNASLVIEHVGLLDVYASFLSLFLSPSVHSRNWRRILTRLLKQQINLPQVVAPESWYHLISLEKQLARVAIAQLGIHKRRNLAIRGRHVSTNARENEEGEWTLRIEIRNGATKALAVKSREFSWARLTLRQSTSGKYWS